MKRETKNNAWAKRGANFKRMAKGKTEKAGKEHETRKGDRKHQDKKEREAKGKGSIQIRKGRPNAEEATKGHIEGMEQEYSLRRRRTRKPRRAAGRRRSNI